MNRPEISREALGFPVPIPTLPEVVMDAKVAVPDNAGLAERTTDPEPVEDVTPVPPLVTGRAVVSDKVDAAMALAPAMAP